MAPTRHFAAAAVLCLLVVISGARAGAAPSPKPSPSPSPAAKAKPKPMTQADAEKVALKEAAKLGYENPKFDGVKLDEDAQQWRVNVRGKVGTQPAKLELTLDARDGKVVALEDGRPGNDDREGKRRRGGRDVD